MDELIQKYQDLKTKRDHLDKDARDYIKENTKDARDRAQKLTNSHVRLLKFLRSLTRDELTSITESQNMIASGNTNQTISKLMNLFDHTSEDN
jgi:hypothetical protein